MDTAERAQQHFYCCFRLSIGAPWQFEVGFSAVILITVDSGSGREDEVLALRVLFHEFEQIHGTDHVVLVVEHGLGEGLSDGLFGSKVHDGIDGFLLLQVKLEHAVEEFEVDDVALVEAHAPGDFLL